MLPAVVSALGNAHRKSFADSRRTFINQNRIQVAERAFDDCVTRADFEAFMRGMHTRLIEYVRVRTVALESEAAIDRITAIEPAAAEVPATCRHRADEGITVHLARDCRVERQFLPNPAALQGRLLPADGGYSSVAYFEAVDRHGDVFIARRTRSDGPWFRAARPDGRRSKVPTRLRVSGVLAQHAGHHADRDAENVRGPRVVGFRVVMLPHRDTTSGFSPTLRSASAAGPSCRRAGWPRVRTTSSGSLSGAGLLVTLRRGLAYALANARRASIRREYRTGPGLAAAGLLK